MNLDTLIIASLVVLLLWFVLREVNAWYWKINEMLGLLREIRDRLPHVPASGEKHQEDLLPSQLKCPHCSEELELDESERQATTLSCPSCGKEIKLRSFLRKH